MTNIFDPQVRKDLVKTVNKCRKYSRKIDKFKSTDISKQEADDLYFPMIETLAYNPTSYEEFRDQALDETNTLRGAVSGNVFGPVAFDGSPWTQKKKIQLFHWIVIGELDWWLGWVQEWTNYKVRIIDAKLEDDEELVNKYTRKMERLGKVGEKTYPFYSWFMNDVGKDPDDILHVAKKHNKECLKCIEDDICEIKDYN